MSSEGTSSTKDTVILHQTGRAKHSPGLSPFAIKVETYLRMANIPYKSVHGKKKSPKGKVPWIEYNGETVSDSSFIIEFLNKKLDVDLQKELSNEQKAVGQAFQRLVEENLYWSLLYARMVDKEFSSTMRENMPRGFMMDISLWRGKGQVQKALHNQGLGRHSRAEIYQIAEHDIQALSNYLGENQFYFGDGGSDVDASIFGLLATFAYELPGSPQEKLLKGDCKNLYDYCERMKEKYWPDWDKCIMGDTPITSFPAVPDSDPTVLKVETSKESKKKDKGKVTENNQETPPAAEGDAATNGVANGTDEAATAEESTEQPTDKKADEKVEDGAQNGKQDENVAEATDKTKTDEAKKEEKAAEPPKEDAKAEEPPKVENEAEKAEAKEDKKESEDAKKDSQDVKDAENGDAKENGKVEDSQQDESKKVNGDEEK
ncbi:failed axon connections homolog [Glandiceps talaboti]